MTFHNVEVRNALSRDMKDELESRGFWVYKPFWRKYRDAFRDRWCFWRKECGYGFWTSLVFSV